MSTESFESVYERLYPQLHNPCGLWKAATIAEWLDDLERAHDREIRDVSQREFARGMDAGQHSMDAEHRAVAMRLRGLRFDGGSHENLSRIAYAIYPCATGWTCESADGLRDKLIDLIGGVSDDTCDSQCRGACADDCGRDSGKHEEVGHGGTAHDSGGDTGGSYRGVSVHLDGLTTYDVLWNERHEVVRALRDVPDASILSTYHACMERLFDAVGVSGKICCESIDNFRDRLIHLLGGDQPSGIDVLRAMDEREAEGRITDELRECVDTAAKSYDNTPWYDMDDGEEADHTTCHITEGELMRIADRIDEQFGRICQQQEAVLQETIDEMVEERDHWKQAVAIKAKALLEISGENESLEAECEKLERQRDLWHQEANNLMRRSDDMERERDELRDEDVKIKRQYAELCVERADLLDLLRDARDEYKSLDRASAETSANFHAMRDRVWGAEAERDELRRKVDELESFDPETSIAAFGDDNGKLRRTLSRAATLLANAEQDRDANYAYWMDCKEKVVHANATIEELQAKLDAIRDALDG